MRLGLNSLAARLIATAAIWTLLLLVMGGVAIFIATRRAWRARETATALVSGEAA